jgi:hypothetical protein
MKKRTKVGSYKPRQENVDKLNLYLQKKQQKND